MGSKFSYRFGVLISTASSLLSRALAIVSGIILAKILFPEALGRFSGDQALIFIGAGLINLGIGHGYRQIVSRYPELRDRYLLPTIFLRLITMLLYFGGLTVYLKYANRWNRPTVLVTLSALIFQLMELFQVDLQIVRNYIKAAIMNLGAGLVLLLSAIICWRVNSDYNFLVYSYFIFTLLLVILGLILVRPRISSLINFEYQHLIKTSIPFAAAMLTYAFTAYWALTYIRGALGEEQAGYYFLPLKVYQIGLVVGMTVTAVTLPLFHKLFISKEFTIFSRVFWRVTRGMWLVGGVIVGICYFIPDFIVRSFANERYLAAVPIFPWIGFGIMFRLLAMPAGNVLESIDKQWYRVGVLTVGAIICMFSVIFIVPKCGIIGAAWTLFAVDLWLVTAYWLISRHFAPAVVCLLKLVVPCSLLVVMLLAISYFLHVSVWVKLLVFCGIWVSYVIVVLNFKEEISGVFKVFLNRV